jgi:hypothetical protein
MNDYRRLLVFVVGLLIFPAATITAAEPSAHEWAARRLVHLTGGAATAESGAEAMMSMIRENPDLAPYEDVFRAWYKKVFASGDFEGETAAIYMKYYTEKELGDLAAFYETPLGRKSLSTLPQIMKEGAELGMARAKEHQPELLQMLAAAKAEHEKKPN